jgi:LAO/AO transport system kinase
MLSSEAWVEAITARNVRAAARFISRIEAGDPNVTPALKELYRRGGRSRIIGITGPPGAGKSTLTGQLTKHYREHGLSVAVLAVDPSSPHSGGAILGDRLRLANHSADPGVFIRSMASRGRLGGLARAVGDTIIVLDAMRWDVVLIETVGVGQSETDIMRHTSAVILLQTAMGGDEVQAAKAGIMEIGDIFVVNKADHPEADRAVRVLEEMISLTQMLCPEKMWRPPVVKTQSLSGDGIGDLVEKISERFRFLESHPDIARANRREQVAHRVAEILRDMADRRLRESPGSEVDSMIDDAITRGTDPITIAERIFSQ